MNNGQVVDSAKVRFAGCGRLRALPRGARAAFIAPGTRGQRSARQLPLPAFYDFCEVHDVVHVLGIADTARIGEVAADLVRS